jgi:hypothetical protein
MTEQNTTTDGQAVETSVETTAKLYPTKADAEAAKPSDAPKSLKPMEVSKNGTVVGWVLCRGYDHGLSIAARLDGYTISTGVKQVPVTKEAAAAKVLEMSDDEFKALVAARRAAAKKS